MGSAIQRRRSITIYGSNTAAGVAGATLASTGLAVGSWVLLAVGVIFAGIAIYTLIKKDSKHRP